MSYTGHFEDRIPTITQEREEEESRIRDTASENRSRITSSTSSASSNTTTVAHGSRRVLEPWELEKIRKCYVDVLGPLNFFKARIIEEAIDHGLQASAIIDALEQTAIAPRPSHAYLSAILRRYICQDIRTVQDAERDRYRRRVEREDGLKQALNWWERSSDELPF